MRQWFTTSQYPAACGCSLSFWSSGLTFYFAASALGATLACKFHLVHLEHVVESGKVLRTPTLAAASEVRVLQVKFQFRIIKYLTFSANVTVKRKITFSWAVQGKEEGESFESLPSLILCFSAFCRDFLIAEERKICENPILK